MTIMGTAALAAPIVVVGGGIGGMATALALARADWDVHLLEQAAEFGEVGAGLQIGPNVMRVFDHLNVLKPIKDAAFFPSNLILGDAIDGSEVVRVPLDRDFIDRFGYPYATLHRADLHAVLTEACRAHPRVVLENGCKVDHFEQNDSCVEVFTASGSTIRARALIGADGVWSAIRGQLLQDGEPRITGHVAYRAVVPADQMPQHLLTDSVVLWAGPDCHVAYYPMRRGELINIGAIFHSYRFQRGADVYGDPAEMHEHFEGTSTIVHDLLALVEEWRMWIQRDRDPAPTWGEGRVTLLGDAAHPTLQYLAQGAGMALEDALTLSRCLEQADHLEQALREYEAKRVVRAGRVTLLSRAYGELYHAKGVGRAVRREMLAGWTPEAAHASFDWLYRGID